MIWQLGVAEDFNPGSGDSLVVFNRRAANADRTDEHAVLIDDGQAAGKGDQAIVGVLDTVAVIAW